MSTNPVDTSDVNLLAEAPSMPADVNLLELNEHELRHRLYAMTRIARQASEQLARAIAVLGQSMELHRKVIASAQQPPFEPTFDANDDSETVTAWINVGRAMSVSDPALFFAFTIAAQRALSADKSITS